MNDKTPDVTRRLALQRLGLAAGAVYMAPVVLSLSDAKASSGSSGGSSGGGGGGGAGGGAGSNSGSSMSMASMSEPSMSGPSDDDTADSGDGGVIRNTASAVVKAPGRMLNGIKGLFTR